MLFKEYQEILMKNARLGVIVAGFLVVGGTVFISSTFAGTGASNGLQVIRHDNAGNVARHVSTTVKPSQADASADSRVVLVAPPGELPTASSRMVTSIAPAAGMTSVKPTLKQKPVLSESAVKSGMTANNEVKTKKTRKVASAQAPAVKANPENLFTLVRLLNYAPHPLSEELLKSNPLAMNGNNYWFTLKYDEDWKVLNDDEGYIQGISFEIDVMENNQKVRSLKTPKAPINASKITKGQILGIAEVAPYKFTIKVEEVTKNKKGVSELVFKLDLLG